MVVEIKIKGQERRNDQPNQYLSQSQSRQRIASIVQRHHLHFHRPDQSDSYRRYVVFINIRHYYSSSRRGKTGSLASPYFQRRLLILSGLQVIRAGRLQGGLGRSRQEI